ncbi:MAG: MerR family transcriptional regulator [Myxococcota bacterium]
MTEGTGCTPRTVRYYERQGLLRAHRTSGGHRQFAPSELERLGFIIALREAGWSLEDVTALLEVRDAAPSDASATAHLTRVLEAQIDALQRKLELLQRLRDEFGETADLLAVCQTCTSVQTRASCEGCDRLPELSALPRPFRVIWRAHELDGAEAFDDDAADDDDAAVV